MRRASSGQSPRVESEAVPDRPAGPAGSLASAALGWSFLNTLVGRLGTVGIGIVLARLLGPHAFGTYAVATVALLAILSFNDLGVSLAIVRWPGDPRRIAPTVTTLSVASSALLALACYFAAPGFSAAMGDPSATAVVRLMLVSLVVNGLVATPAALMQREFAQGRRMVIDQVNVWLGALVSIALALAGMGAMSLAVGRIVGTVVSGVMFLVIAPGPYRFGWAREVIRPLLAFGLPLAGSSVVVFAVGYADQLIAGHILGPKALGFYVLAFNLASWPVSMFSQPLRNVAPAAFSRMQYDPDGMTRTLTSVLGLLTAVTLPVCLLLAGAAAPVVAVVYGPDWAPSAPVLTLLAGLAAFRIVFELAYDFLVVIGRTRVILRIQLVWLVALVPGLLFAAHWWGLAGLAAVQVVIAGAVITPMYLAEFRAFGVGAADVLRGTGPAVAAGVVVGAATWALSRSHLPALAVCALGGVLSAAVVGALVYGRRVEFGALRRAGARPAEPAVPA